MTYYKRNEEKIKKDKDRYDKSGGGDFKFWVPKEGKNNIRILPPWSEAGYWYLEVPYHYGIGEGQAIICPKRFKNKRCYICEKIKEFRNGPEELKTLASKLRPTSKIYYNILDLDHINDGVQIYGSGITVFKELMYYDFDPEWGDITDPEHGYDIVVERKGKGLNTEYSVKAKKNPTPLTIDNLDLFNLDMLASNIYTYEKIRMLYEGIEESESEFEEEAEEKPTPATSKPRPTPIKPTETVYNEPDPPAEAEQEPAEEESISSEEAEEEPGCFGDDYEEKSRECQNCDWKDGCAEKWTEKQNQKPQRGRPAKK